MSEVDSIQIVLGFDRHDLDRFTAAYRDVLAIAEDCESFEEMEQRVPEATAQFIEEFGAELLAMLHSGYSLLLSHELEHGE